MRPSLVVIEIIFYLLLTVRVMFLCPFIIFVEVICEQLLVFREGPLLPTFTFHTEIGHLHWLSKSEEKLALDLGAHCPLEQHHHCLLPLFYI